MVIDFSSLEAAAKHFDLRVVENSSVLPVYVRRSTLAWAIVRLLQQRAAKQKNRPV